MSNHSVRRSRTEVRAYMADHQVNYTTALRVLTEQADAADSASSTAAPAAPAAGRFGGHEFEYERDTDLFRCTECGEYEVVAEADDGTFTACPGLPGWDGDTERVYLLITENAAVYNVPWHVSTAAREHGIGRTVRFGYRDNQLLVETAPSVADKLHRLLAALTEAPSSATSLPKAGADRVAVATAIERLTFEQGQAVIAANHAAYVAEYGDDDRSGPTRTVVIGAGSPETSALTRCPECGSPEWLDDGRRGWNPIDVECEVCAGTYDSEPEGEDDAPAAACIRCGRTFAEDDDYHQVAMSGPNSLLFIHSEDC